MRHADHKMKESGVTLDSGFSSLTRPLTCGLVVSFALICADTSLIEEPFEAANVITWELAHAKRLSVVTRRGDKLFPMARHRLISVFS